MTILATAPQALDDFFILDTRSHTGVAPLENQARMNCLATISAGRKIVNPKDSSRMIPARSQDGEIYVHGEAPYLKRALKANGDKFLTVVFQSDNPRDFIQQRFTEYSATQLLTYGDERSVTQITQQRGHVEYQAGTPEYAAAIARCKVSISIYFALAEWSDAGAGIPGADILFQDGLGLYRLRTTSLNSLHSILFSVQHMKKLTGGKLAGIPFDLFLRKEERADSTGVRRPCWIWQAVPRPPKGIRLNVETFRQFAEHGTQQMNVLQLTAPPAETLENALMEAPFVVEDDFIDAEAEFASTPTPTAPEPEPEPTKAPAQPETALDVREYQKRYFAIAQGSPYSSDAGRHAFVSDFTGGVTTSLGEFLKTTRPDVADAMLTKLEALVKGEEVEEAPPAPAPIPATVEQRREYEDLQYRFTLIKAEPPKDLPENISSSSAAKWIARAQEEIDKKQAEIRAKTEAELGAKSAAAPAADPELQPQTPLSQAVRDKAQAQPVDGEAEELFGGGDDGNYPPYIRHAMAAAYDAGFTHNGDLAYPPLIDAINANTKGLFLKTPITTLDGLPEMTASLITSFCETRRLKP